MALPPGFLDELRSRLTLSDVAGRKVLWDRRKSNPAKGDFWAPCPFHQEKTPSFHVDDRKGFYYCFGCHAKGDMISFVKDTENVPFIEAVEILAREAGLEMPARTRDPRAAEKRDRAERLAEVMEQAVKAFGLALRSGAGAPVRDYIQRRGLGAETVKRFEIGFAPDARQHLTEAFRAKGLLDEAIAAGLVIRADDGATYDRFRGRLMFPIRDPRGRCIAFGGRAMDPNARAKYLNSPETELFHKSRVLYNHGPAREAAGKAGALIVAEGYMDVIALAEAGFGHAVAPLGTAITEDQLGQMWRIADEPAIALDGDAAGLRAAERLVDLALPLLTPGKSLRFCLMPEGRDPDDLIRAEGPAAMQAALDAAVPLIEMLWRRETRAAPLDTPERRAALDQRLKAALERIRDPGVRSHYAADLRARRAELFRPARPERAASPARTGWRQGPAALRGAYRRGIVPARPTEETLRSDLARNSAADTAQARLREGAILLIALKNPEAARRLEGALDAMPCHGADTAALRDALLDALAAGPAAEAVAAALGPDRSAALDAIPHARAHPFARTVADQAAAARVLHEAIERHQALLGLAADLSEARRDLALAADGADGTPDAAACLTLRLAQSVRERLAADGRAVAEDAEAEAAETDSAIQRLIDQGVWRRGRPKALKSGP